MKAIWNFHWRAANASFEEKLNVGDDHVSLRNKIFLFGNKITRVLHGDDI